MNRHVVAVTAALAACGGVIGACAVPPGELELESAQEATADALTAAPRPLVGTYVTDRPAAGGFARLTLEPGGTYTADIDPGPGVLCIRAPCVVTENGTYGVFPPFPVGRLRLVLTPAGGSARSYEALALGDRLVLARGGQSEVLTRVSARFCGGIAGLPCGPGERCVDDPSDDCDPRRGGADCGGVCRPSSCWGAWLDANAVCRTPADGVYPPSCCADGRAPPSPPR